MSTVFRFICPVSVSLLVAGNKYSFSFILWPLRASLFRYSSIAQTTASFMPIRLFFGVLRLLRVLCSNTSNSVLYLPSASIKSLNRSSIRSLTLSPTLIPTINSMLSLYRPCSTKYSDIRRMSSLSLIGSAALLSASSFSSISSNSTFAILSIYVPP